MENTSNSHPYVNIIKDSYEKCLRNESQLSPWVLGLQGMSGSSYRHFINNVISSLDDARYLEIGSWKGSTLCAAIFNNNITAYAIDDWSTDGGPREEFNQNVEKCIKESSSDFDIKYNFEENDYNKVDYNQIGKYNILFYDGPHEEHEQYNGVVLPLPALDDTFILIVDDWSWQNSKDGTNRAIKDLNLEVLHSIEIESCGGWHNGYFIAVVKK